MAKSKKPVILTSVTKKVIDKAFIVEQLKKSDKWLFRAIVSIYEFQTPDEQSAEVTAHDNGVGFNSADSYILSRFAKQLLSAQANGWKPSLSPKQLAIARKKMPKYSGQLLKMAESKVKEYAAI